MSAIIHIIYLVQIVCIIYIELTNKVCLEEVSLVSSNWCKTEKFLFIYKLGRYILKRKSLLKNISTTGTAEEVLRHTVAIKAVPFPTFRLILKHCVLSAGTQRCVAHIIIFNFPEWEPKASKFIVKFLYII